MITLAFGVCAYMITLACVIYYKMVLKREDPDWLAVYLPLNVICFILFVIGWTKYLS